MELILFWKGKEFSIRPKKQDTFLDVIHKFVSMEPNDIDKSKIKSIRLLHDSETIDLTCPLSKFQFMYDYTFVVYLSKENSVSHSPSSRYLSSNPQHEMYNKKIHIDLVNICTKVHYSQVVLETSQIGEVIDNLRMVLKPPTNIVLFNEKGLFKSSDTFRSLSIQNGDTIGVLCFSIAGTDLLQLKELVLLQYSSHERYIEAIRDNPTLLLRDLSITYMLRSPSDFINVLTSLSSLSFKKMSICDSVESIEFRVNRQSAIASEYVSIVDHILIPWNYVMNMPIQSFFSHLTHFKSLNLLMINYDHLVDIDKQELYQVLSDLQLPIYILINSPFLTHSLSVDNPLLSIQSYVDHIATHQKSSQAVIQTLKKKVDTLEESEKSNEKQIKEVTESNQLLKRNLETAQEREKQLSTELDRLRKQSLPILKNGILPLCESIKQACQTIHFDVQKLNQFDSKLTRNISGASNFCLQEVQKIANLLCTIPNPLPPRLDGNRGEKRPNPYNPRNPPGGYYFAPY